MIRGFNIVMAVTSVVALVGVYGLKYSVEQTASDKAALERAIDRQEGELSLLKADWAYLNQPAHIQPIITRHAEALGLQPVTPQQFGGLDGLPMRAPPPDSQALDDLFMSLEAGVDPAEQDAIGE
jgi:hypothetical protein